MINLLPVQVKQNIKKEYFARIISVLFIMFAFALVSVFVLLLVMLFRLNLEEKDFIALKNINYQKNQNSESLFDVVGTTNKKLLLLSSDRNKRYLHDDVFKTIITHRGGVGINALTYELDKDIGAKVRVQGVSPARDDLFSFIKALEGVGFKEVNSPVSNYVQDKDIPFFLEVVL